jgi:hypothetical protein
VVHHIRSFLDTSNDWYSDMGRGESVREIKFRAWDIRKEKMRGCMEIIWFEDGSLRVNATESEVNYEPLVNVNDGVQECILMQYTGLKDKNGKEIYEGDVLKGRKYLITVTFYKGMFSGKQHGINYTEPLASWEMSCFEVIGNIYQNPDLIKKAE